MLFLEGIEIVDICCISELTFQLVTPFEATRHRFCQVVSFGILQGVFHGARVKIASCPFGGDHYSGAQEMHLFTIESSFSWEKYGVNFGPKDSAGQPIRM